MRKTKRKYTRKVVQSKSSPVEEESSIKVLRKVTQADIDLLPPSLVYQLKAGTEMRRRFKLPDDLKERTEQMVRRFRGF